MSGLLFYHRAADEDDVVVDDLDGDHGHDHHDLDEHDVGDDDN